MYHKGRIRRRNELQIRNRPPEENGSKSGLSDGQRIRTFSIPSFTCFSSLQVLMRMSQRVSTAQNDLYLMVRVAPDTDLAGFPATGYPAK